MKVLKKNKTLYFLDDVQANTNFYWNGIKESQSYYLDRRRTGRYTQYFDDGSISITGRYNQGLKDGLRTTWYYTYPHQERRIESKENYLNGIREGLYERWYINGTKQVEGRYHNGKEIGEWKSWEFGRLIIINY